MKLDKSGLIIAASLSWFVLLLQALRSWPEARPVQILTIVHLILISHILFGAYFASKLAGQLDRLSLFCLGAGAVIALSLIPFLNYNLVIFGLAYEALFLAARTFHQQLLRLNLNPALNRLCRYKLNLEIEIMIFIALIVSALEAFPTHQILISLMALALILARNVLIIFRDRIYQPA